jgi:hypothetical protein
MSVLSLQKSVRTCRVDTGYADKLQSERFLNSCQVVCPVWSGTDQYGRMVCPDSAMIEVAGCRSALDRVDVENYQRPQYFELVNLDGFGVQGNIYSDDAGNRTALNQNLAEIVGNPGYDYGNYVAPKCVSDRYEEYQYESRAMCR